ncbi:MAG: ATP-binding protein [Ignavibacteria bacterium]|nr:ATP-binding protein [Ignavibacteria bacterium]
MCKDALGDLWVTTYGGDILQIRGKKILRRCHSGLHKTPGYDTFYSLHDDGKGQLWASTWSGLLRIPKDHLSRYNIVQYTSENGLPEDMLFTFLIDREENYWIGTQTRGVAKLTEKNVYKFLFPGFTFHGINNSSGTSDRFGRIWLAASKGIWEIWCDDQDRWHTFFHRLLDERSRSSLINIICDSQDQIWIGRNSPTTIRCYSIDRQFDRESRLNLKKELLLRREIPDGMVGFILDRRGYLWISTTGVAVVDPSKLPRLKRVFTEADGIPPGSIRALYEDHNGNIWLGGGYGGGVAMVPKGDWNRAIAERYTLDNGLPDDLIRALGEDKNGRLLIGSRFGGLTILDHGQFTTYTTKDGLLSNGILGIVRDSLGNIIVGTHLGLQVFNAASSIAFESNNELVGIQAVSSGVCPNQDIWLVGQDALIIYEYSKRRRSPLPPPVYITNITVNGNKVPTDGTHKLSHDQNNVLLNFVGISFKDERAIRYQYRLIENDRDWQPLTKQTSVTYAALKPGAYTFEVKAINADGIKSTQPAIFAFTILSPFWLRWWFILLVNAVIIGIITLGYRYRMYQLLKIERMRTRIASDLHDDIGASLTRIALFSEVAKEEAATSSPKLIEMADKIGMNARELLDAVGTLVWSIDPRHDRFEDVLTHLKNFAQEMLSMKGIDYSFNVQQEARQLNLPLDARKNILLVFKEAINNIVKHAHCKRVEIDLELRNGQFEMRIADDGKGIASTILRPGHGLMNMRMRAQAIGGEFDIKTTKGQGTVVLLKLPVATRK